MEKNERFDVSVTDTTVFGNGVTRIDNLVSFVEGAVEGDECSIIINSINKNFSFSKCEKIHKFSPYRTEADCPYFDKCGGCSLRHLNYEYEGTAKEKYVKSALRKCGIDESSVNPILMPSPDFYRNKATFRFDGKGGFGFFEEGSNSLVSISDYGCKIIPTEFYTVADSISKYISDTSVTLTVRKSTNNKILALLEGKAPLEKIGNELNSLGYGISLFSLFNGKLNKVFGEDRITYQIGDIIYYVSPTAFFQVNNEGLSMMLGEIGRMTEGMNIKTIVDLYCGTGSLGLYLASKNKGSRVYGIEINKKAVRDAEINAHNNGIDNASFFTGDAADFKLADGSNPELVIIDPPRAGCSEKTINTLLSMSPETIVYVSCNPATLSRDLKKLIPEGYTVKEATPINMFPRSEHVETVVLLSK